MRKSFWYDAATTRKPFSTHWNYARIRVSLCENSGYWFGWVWKMFGKCCQQGVDRWLPPWYILWWQYVEASLTTNPGEEDECEYPLLAQIAQPESSHAHSHHVYPQVSKASRPTHWPRLDGQGRLLWQSKRRYFRISLRNFRQKQGFFHSLPGCRRWVHCGTKTAKVNRIEI